MEWVEWGNVSDKLMENGIEDTMKVPSGRMEWVERNQIEWRIQWEDQLKLESML
jgi:hypothetical protein